MADDLVRYLATYCDYSVQRYRQYTLLPQELTVGHLVATDKFMRRLIREFSHSHRFTVTWESLLPWQQACMCLLQERIAELAMAVSHLLEETGQSTSATDSNLFFLDLTCYHDEIAAKEPHLSYNLQDELAAVTYLWELLSKLGSES